MSAYSPRYEAALTLAARAHRTQVRKGGGDTPYLVHPVHVSVLLLRHGFAEDVVVAGLLHDVVEDQDVSLAEIEGEFGPAVAAMVDAVTEKKLEHGAERPWKVRKGEALDKIELASLDAVALKAADVLHNSHAIAGLLRADGPSIWERFKRGPEQSLWYYRSAAALVRRRLGAHPLVDELDAAIADLEQAVAESTDR